MLDSAIVCVSVKLETNVRASRPNQNMYCGAASSAPIWSKIHKQLHMSVQRRSHTQTLTYWWSRTETSIGALLMCLCLLHRVSGPKTNNVEKPHTHAECNDATETNAYCCVSLVSFVCFYLFVLGHCTYVHCICFYFFIFLFVFAAQLEWKGLFFKWNSLINYIFKQIHWRNKYFFYGFVRSNDVDVKNNNVNKVNEIHECN